MREIVNPSVVLKEYLNPKDYQDISSLHDLCVHTDQITLKLELDYKLSRANAKPQSLGHFNEFLCYADNSLIGYIGICQFGNNAMEVTGMVHPDYRRKGVFTKLFALVKDEWSKRESPKLLLLSDAKSASGQAFIASTPAQLAHSEYEMFLTGKPSQGTPQFNVSLRKAHSGDAREIAIQNAIYFNTEFNEDNISLPEEQEATGTSIYLGQVDYRTVGKVHVEVRNGVGGIYGLGVLPDYRGKGYGRELLLLAIEQLKQRNAKDIMLQVAAKNATALNLYKSCGFEETSVMEYYELNKPNLS